MVKRKVIPLEEQEQRQYEVLSRASAMGRSTVTVRCPFCKAAVTCYVWSLAGGGKRCDCGALFTRLGSAFKPKE